jgi:hypothetical protein
MDVCILYPQDWLCTYFHFLGLSKESTSFITLPCAGFSLADSMYILARSCAGASALIADLCSFCGEVDHAIEIRDIERSVYFKFAQTIDCILAHVFALYTISSDQFNHHDLASTPITILVVYARELALFYALFAPFRCSKL